MMMVQEIKITTVTLFETSFKHSLKRCFTFLSMHEISKSNIKWFDWHIDWHDDFVFDVLRCFRRGHGKNKYGNSKSRINVRRTNVSHGFFRYGTDINFFNGYYNDIGFDIFL